MLNHIRRQDSPWVAAGAVLLVIGILSALGLFYPSTKLGFLLVIVLGIVNRRLRGFAIDFFPFMLLLWSYNSLRGFADSLTRSEIHIVDLIRWERDLFGGALPGYELQTALRGEWFTPLVDVLTNGLYLSHFLTPVILALLLWREHRGEYWAYMFGLVALSYAAFATYVLFPAAPPWWATAHGYLRSMPITLDSFVFGESTVRGGPNPVAAMPSLHIGYPTFLALVSTTVWGRRGLVVWLLPLGVGFSAVYLGHHYVIDGLAGIAYAGFIYGSVYWWARKQNFTFETLHVWARILEPDQSRR